jgi:hypothetical protein
MTGGATQVAANVLDGDASTQLFDHVISSSWQGATTAVNVHGLSTGDEIWIGKNFRLAPYGNRIKDKFPDVDYYNQYGELPHYHQRLDGWGGSLDNHRPWEPSWLPFGPGKTPK